MEPFIFSFLFITKTKIFSCLLKLFLSFPQQSQQHLQVFLPLHNIIFIILQKVTLQQSINVMQFKQKKSSIQFPNFLQQGISPFKSVCSLK